MWLNQDFNFLLCKNLNSSFSTRLTHSILEVSLHFWLIWPMVGQAGSEWKSMYLYSNRSPVGGTTEAYSNSVYPGALLYQYMLGCWSIKDYDLLAISPMGFFIPEVSWVGLLLEGMKGACLFICPLARKSSIRISHSKKVQQWNLPQQKSPAVESPKAK